MKNNGMELSREYYEAFGRPMIHEKFPEYEDRIATGLAGEGSECFGFDDEHSRDHDFGPAFCMWLDDETAVAVGERLQAEYERLPMWFGGVKTRRDSALSGHRTGVWRISEFYGRFLSAPGVPGDLMEWLRLPESYLAAAVNGQVFTDPSGIFTGIRGELLKGYPEDVRIKKMVARAAVMSQAGQYNYPRCKKRGEEVAAALALGEFMKAGMSMIYLLNRRYAPFYKWMHRGMRDLPVLGETSELFAALAGPAKAGEKQRTVEEICAAAAKELKRQGLTSHEDPFLQNHLDEMMDKIEDGRIRQMHWLIG